MVVVSHLFSFYRKISGRYASIGRVQRWLSIGVGKRVIIYRYNIGKNCFLWYNSEKGGKI